MTSTDASKSPVKADEATTAKAKRKVKSKAPSRLDQLQKLLTSECGASIAELAATTGWQQHSVRGAMAGALKKRGLAITSEKVEGVRRYHAVVPA